MGNIFDENDIKSLFSSKEADISVNFEPEPFAPEPPKPEAKPKEKPSRIIIISRFVSLFIVIFILTFSLINYTALFSKVRYFFNTSILHKGFSIVTPSPTANPFDPTTEARMTIPKIGVDAPIIWNVSEDNMKDKLLEGLSHAAGTALPGQNGNIFIVGHSSYYSWVSSPYKDVFALLDKLEKGDKIFINYSSKVFTYEVNGSKVVKPSETSVMDQYNGFNLSLMTCVPVGTNLNRLIITANQINGT